MGSRVWLFGVTWRHRSRDRWTRHMWFPIGGLLEPSVSLAPLRRYSVSKIMGSRPWPFGVTWRHRSRDHQTHCWHFLIGGQWWPCAYLARIRRYGALKILGSRVWPFGVTWRHRSRYHSTRHRWFFIGGPLKPCVYLAPLRSYKASKLLLFMLKAKSLVRMRRVTWPVGRKFKMTTYLEFPRPYCLFTIQFYEPTMTIRGRLWVKFLYMSVFGRNFQVRFCLIFDFGGIFQGLDINFEFSTFKKAYPCVRPRRLNYRAWKSADRSDL